ncbi:MAG: hypothetical protein AB1586_06800 [Pseudomonadota bacterium]|jgi:hypothetical protein
MNWGKFSENMSDDPDAGAPTGCKTDRNAFSAEEGLELLALFQTIRQRADRRAALDLVRQVAACSGMIADAMAKPHA